MSNPDCATTGDARALQLRLYRDLGIAAVAAALDVTVDGADLGEMAPHIPAMVADETPHDLAA